MLLKSDTSETQILQFYTHCITASVYFKPLIVFSEDSTIIPEHHSCCGYHGYDNRTQLCTDNYKVINRSSRNNGSLSKRQRVSRSICNTCHWRHRRSYREIKSGNQYVCKRHSRCYFLSINFNIYLEF